MIRLKDAHTDALMRTLDRMYEQCPLGMTALVAWLNTTHYGSVTLRFQDGRLYCVEHNETAK